MEAESVEDLIEAKTESARKMALNSLSGKTTNMISNLREKMVSLLANIEVNIDYPEYTDELQITKESITPVLSEIRTELQNIIKESVNSRYIKEGINIAIIGRPNVGKSSLLNTLIEEDKAIVTDISGTTRDTVEGSIIYKGLKFNFIDTAGIRETKDVVEKIGVEKSKKVESTSDITILVLNAHEKITKEDKELLNLVENKKAIIFINKNDQEKNIEKINTKLPIISGSTNTNTGIDSLKEKIIEILKLSDLSSKDLTYLSNARQISLAKNALKCIEHVIEENKKDIPVDMLAIDIKSAWDYLGSIIGESYEDELVDNIFKRFCLGK